RDTADKVAVAEKLIEVNDKAKAEVVLDVELLQLSTTKLLELGATLSSYKITGSPNLGTGTTSLPWQDLLKLSLSDFNFTVPSVAVSFIKQNSDSELLAKPQLRIAEGEKAQLVIGDRVPIPVTTINTQQAIGQTGVVPVTSFQYQDVGIKLDIEARVHHNREISLKLTVEISEINGYVENENQGRQPIIGTRTITTNIRLKDGETSFLAGLIKNKKVSTKEGLPFLSEIPLLGSLFKKTSNDVKHDDIFLTLTPHITRAPQITEEDLIPVWVGTENNVSFSGLNVRLESPQAPETPFDPPAEAPASRPVSPTSPVPGTMPGRAILPVQGSGPNDPFRRTPAPAPQGGSNILSGDAAQRSAAFVETEGPRTLALGLELENGELEVGETALLTLTGPSELADAGALEVTIEWDPSVAELVAVTPGPWRTGSAALNTRLDADRGPGRVRIGLGTPTGVVGLPSGALARFTLRALAPGEALVRVSAGAGLGKSGPLRPEANAVPLVVRD
ncbi:MAG: hypothetical protein KBB14_05325, partial [Thermoanaerobaculia bacterium]|nr:hypothetical protein [Thermoanaerobaculia bacterium]